MFLDYIEWFTDRSKQWDRFLEMLDGRTPMSVMLIEAPAGMGKTFLLKKMEYHCAESGLARVYIDFARQEVANDLWFVRQVRDQLGPDVGRHHFNRVVEQINHYTDPRLSGRAPGIRQMRLEVQLPASDGEAPRVVRIDLVALRKNLISSFNHEEMKALAFDLGFYTDDIEGRNRSAYALSLLTRCERFGKILDLLLALRRERVGIPWWEELESGDATVSEESGGQSVAQGIQLTTDRKEIVRDWRLDTLPADRRVLAEALAEINGAFQNCLSAISDQRNIVFVIDSFERAGEEAQPWIVENLIWPIINGQLSNVLLFLAGQQIPELGDRRPIVGKTDLKPFTREHVREYIEERRKLTVNIDELFRFSDGKPRLMAQWVDAVAEDDLW